MDCKQLIYTASYHTLDTDGQPVFGVRAIAGRLEPETATAMANLAVADGYIIDIGDIVDGESLTRCPDRLCDFSPIISLRRFIDNKGRESYLASRTVYIGPGPDYYTGLPATATLPGNNFISHILVFDKYPSLALFSSLSIDAQWIPASVADAPANCQLRSLASDSDYYLAPITVGDPRRQKTDPSLCSPVMLTLVAMVRLLAQEKTAAKAVIVTNNVTGTIDSLALLPPRLLRSLTFTTSTGLSASIAPDIDLAIVSPAEFELLDRRNLFVVNAEDTSIEWHDNRAKMLLNLFTDMTRQNDGAELDRFVKWICELRLPVNLGLELGRYVAGRPDLAFFPEIVSDELVGVFTKLSAEKRRRLATRLQPVINQLLMSRAGLDIMNGLLLLSSVGRHLKTTVSIDAAVALRLSKVYFQRGANAYLGRMATAENVAPLAAIVPPSMMGTEETFLAALSQSADATVWQTLLDHYYSGASTDNPSPMLDAIASSALKSAEKERIISKRFPPQSQTAFISRMVEWYRNNPLFIAELPGPLLAVAASAREECFSRFLTPDTPDAAFKVMRPAVINYFRPLIHLNPTAAMEQVIRLINAISPDVFHLQGFNEPLVYYWLDEAYATPSQSAVGVIDRLKKLHLELPDGVLDRMITLHCLLCGRVPAKITTEGLLFALKLPKFTPTQFSKLTRLWAAGNLTTPAIVQFMKRAQLGDPRLIEALINALWTSESRNVAADRRRMIIAVADYAVWDAETRTAFTNSLSDDRLVSLLRDADSSLGRLWRKLLRHLLPNR